MTVKSVIDIQVNDEAFKTFHALFQKYKAQADKVPDAWKEVNQQTAATASNFGDMVAAMMAQATLQDTLDRKSREADKRQKAAETRQGKFWRELKTNSKAVAGNIKDATVSLLKWSSITTVVSGLLGAGGLYGIDRLALGVGAGRRSALGVGTSYGAQKAFETDFGRLVDPGAVLSGVSESLHDVTKRWQLLAAGVSSGAIATGDSGVVGADLLSSVKKLVDRTPSGQLQQLSDSRGLGQFFSLQDLVRLKATSGEEFATQQAAFRRDSVSFGLGNDTQRRMQDFATQLSRAGTKIETVFVKGLDPLVPSLTKLSDSIANAVGTLLDGIKPADIQALGTGIEDFAKYLSSPGFKENVKDFTTDIGTLAHTIADALHALGAHTVKDAAFGAAAGFALGGPGGAAVGAAIGGAVGSLRDGRDPNAGPSPFTDSRPNRPFHWYDPGSYRSRDGGLGAFGNNNPGNIRNPNGLGFRAFESPEAGVRGVADQLLRYEYAKKWGHLDTIAKIIATYAPKADGNDVASYIKDVTQRTGFGANEHLELSDKSTLAKLTSAILGHENRNGKKYTPSAVVTILNNTGGSAVVQTAQAARQ